LPGVAVTVIATVTVTVTTIITAVTTMTTTAGGMVAGTVATTIRMMTIPTMMRQGQTADAHAFPAALAVTMQATSPNMPVAAKPKTSTQMKHWPHPPERRVREIARPSSDAPLRQGDNIGYSNMGAAVEKAMTTTSLSCGLTRLGIALLLALSPFQIKLHSNLTIDFGLTAAFAKGENSGSGGGGSGNSGSGNSGSGNSGSGNSGSGGGDDDDDHSGSGNSGSGNSGQGSGGSDDDDDGSGSNNRNSDNKNPPKKPAIARIRSVNGGVKVEYVDGSREEIRNGKYERRNANGKVVEKRLASGYDVARIRSQVAASNIENAPEIEAPTTRAVAVTITGTEIDVQYSNGWRERIVAGQYQLTDQFGRIAVARTASKRDWARLKKTRP
jgi:uncharacterized membrane protein YgcG